MNELKNRTLLLRVSYKVPFLLVVVLLFISISSFHKTKTDQEPESKTITDIIKWYDLYLVLESKDYSAYPPLSTKNILTMGLAGKLTLQAFEDKNLPLDDDFNLAINEVLRHVIHDIFDQGHNENITTLLAGMINVTDAKGQLDPKIEQIIQKVISHLKISEAYFNDNKDCSSDLACFLPTNLLYKRPNPVLPNWGDNPTFVISKTENILPNPYQNSSSLESDIYHDAISVYTQSLNMSKEDHWIAEFWSDDVRGLTFSPAGRWISITNQLVKSEKLSLSEVVDLYFRLGVGMYDGALLAWKYKYNYGLQRPSHYIKKHIDPSWQPLHADPNFPAYPSGHAVLGAVASKILEGRFGGEYAFTDRSHQTRNEFLGHKRSFKSLESAAIENAYSRFLLGVHYKEDCEEGLKMGFRIGDKINGITTEDWQCLLTTRLDLKDHMPVN